MTEAEMIEALADRGYLWVVHNGFRDGRPTAELFAEIWLGTGEGGHRRKGRGRSLAEALGKALGITEASDERS